MLEPTNEDRAGWARDAIHAFMDVTMSGSRDPEDYQCAIGDLLADMRHLAHQEDWDFAAKVEGSLAVFVAEQETT